MAHFLDDLPLNYSRRETRELRDFLAGVYYRSRDVEQLVVQAGISPATILWESTGFALWHEVLWKARNQDRLRALLKTIAESGDGAVATRLQELTASTPVVEAPEPAAVADRPWTGFDDRDELERQIFERPTLLDVAFLRQGLELAPAVARLLVTFPSGRFHGTAFRVGEDLLLTNHHVLYDIRNGDAPATDVEIWFGYERDVAGRILAHETVAGRVETIAGAADHDWAVIRTAAPLGAQIPVIDLDAPAPVAPDDRVYVIQHPHGDVKKIGMHNNLVRHVDDDVVQYWTDTEAGSSGSPVFNDAWQVVALHHRWVQREHDGKGEYRNQGRRIERVVEAMTAAGVRG